MRIIHEVRGSVLWLLRFPAAAEEHLLAMAVSLGASPAMHIHLMCLSTMLVCHVHIILEVSV